jgi:hypothetical protein
MDHPPVTPGPYRLARAVWPVPSGSIAVADRTGALRKGETQPRFVILNGHGVTSKTVLLAKGKHRS